MLRPKHHTTTIKKSAYYSTLGEPNDKVKYLWIVCHGYGQLAKHIIHKFSSIHTEEHFFIAPEGLSRFYWNESKGQVGASWMTKENRLHEIDDYTNYLQQLHDEFKPLCHAEVKVIAFGFSQGVATIWRWAMSNFPALDALIMWAGMTPEDIDYLPHSDYLAAINKHLIYGTSDQYLTQERIDFQVNLEQTQGLQIKHTSFDGKHEVDRNVLEKVFEDYIS